MRLNVIVFFLVWYLNVTVPLKNLSIAKIPHIYRKRIAMDYMSHVTVPLRNLSIAKVSNMYRIVFSLGITKYHFCISLDRNHRILIIRNNRINTVIYGNNISIKYQNYYLFTRHSKNI